MRLLDALRGQRSIVTVDDYVSAVNEAMFNGVALTGGYGQTLVGHDEKATVRADVSFPGHTAAMAKNSVVFACMLNRQLVFSAARFRWQQLVDGSPSKMFGTPALRVLERPWEGGTTQDLLSRMIQDADLAGNSFHTRQGNDVIRLRPDWVEIVVRPRHVNGGVVGWEKVGYVYTEGGPKSGNNPVPLLADEVAHFAPIPDPLHPFRGMSWLTPVAREVSGDDLMETHKRKFFANGATPNMVVKHADGATQKKILDFARKLDAAHGGADNAYKTLHLYPGADATIVGKDMKQIDFKQVQGASETRIAAAAGTPPVIVGLSEGLQAATYSNYSQARRRFGDGTIHPLWQNAAGCLAQLLERPRGDDVRLWYDASDVPFLREDEKDAAEIRSSNATTIRTLVDAGFTPESAVAAVDASDMRLLKHTGLFSVQLQPPGSQLNPKGDKPPAQIEGADS